VVTLTLMAISYAERLRLLVHIIRNLGKYGITSDKLKEVAYDIKRQIDHPEGMEILDEIFRVRKLEERLERQEVGRCEEVVKALLLTLMAIRFFTRVRRTDNHTQIPTL
jgi:Protein of unknown function (DUF2841)